MTEAIYKNAGGRHVLICDGHTAEQICACVSTAVLALFAALPEAYTDFPGEIGESVNISNELAQIEIADGYAAFDVTAAPGDEAEIAALFRMAVCALEWVEREWPRDITIREDEA